MFCKNERKKIDTLIYVILLSMALLPAFAADSRQDSIQQGKSSFIPLPVLFYTPETKLAGGAALNYFFREPGSSNTSRPSSILPSVIYTQKKQMIAELSADFYWHDEAYHFMVYTGYREFPDKFYGIGNNTPESNEENYTPRSVKVITSIQKKIGPGWNAGIQYEFEYCRLIQTESGGLLSDGTIPGCKCGTISGFGILLNMDTRDNIFSPGSGSYFQLSGTLFNEIFGSDYNYNKLNFDFRQYLPLSVSQVIAFQAYMDILRGTPPFRNLSMIGNRINGCNLMRGYYEGRFRDKHLMAFQIEYRVVPVWWKIGLAVFAGLGDVSDKLENFVLHNFKYSMGGGIRFLINRKEKLNIRLDFAYGKDTSGMYITIGEAF